MVRLVRTLFRMSLAAFLVTAMTLACPAGDAGASTVILRIAVSRANIRSGPSTEFKVISSAKRREIFDILDREGSWYKINLEDGREGWLHEKLVAEDILEDYDDQAGGSIMDDMDVIGDDYEGLTFEVVIKVKAANIREKPNTGGQVVTSAGFGEVFELVDRTDGWFHIILPEGGDAYLYHTLAEKRVRSNPALKVYQKLKNLAQNYDQRKSGRIYFQSQGFFPSLGFPNRLLDIRMERDADDRNMVVVDLYQMMKDVQTFQPIGEAPVLLLLEADRSFFQMCLITALEEEMVDKVRIDLHLSRLNLQGDIEYLSAGRLTLDDRAYDDFRAGSGEDEDFWKGVENDIPAEAWLGRGKSVQGN
jgi:uncharacterized protein YgiM (DUF1202 family)